MADWLHVEVTLTGSAELELERPPGRVMLCHRDHSLAELGWGIDVAFGRWDLGHLHEFDVEGRTIVGGDTELDDEQVEDSEEVTLAELRPRLGLRMRYVFDLGEGWTHECEVVADDVEVDPGDEPDGVVPVFGWGWLPDQYGRLGPDDDELDEDDASLDDEGGTGDDLDAAEAWEVVASALGTDGGDPPAVALADAAAALRGVVDDLPPTTAEALARVREAADLHDPPADDAELWVAAAAGVVSPSPQVQTTRDALMAWDAIEHADWAGAVIELVRGGPGTDADPDALLDLIARCPEVEESDLDPDDVVVLRQGLAIAVDLLAALGAVDDHRRLTALGAWGLPRALERAWTRRVPR